MKGDKLIIIGKQFTVENIGDLENVVDQQKTNIRSQEDKVLFHGKEAYLSSFYMTSFTINDLFLNSSEQYYQYSKAMHFKDDETAQNVLASKDALEQIN